jgi:hypothetical protein
MYFYPALMVECHPKPLIGNFAVTIGHFDSILRGIWSLSHLSASSWTVWEQPWNKITMYDKLVHFSDLLFIFCTFRNAFPLYLAPNSYQRLAHSLDWDCYMFEPY